MQGKSGYRPWLRIREEGGGGDLLGVHLLDLDGMGVEVYKPFKTLTRAEGNKKRNTMSKK